MIGLLVWGVELTVSQIIQNIRAEHAPGRDDAAENVAITSEQGSPYQISQER